MPRKTSDHKILFIKAQKLLEFDKILVLLADHAVSAEAKTRILDLINIDLIEDPSDILELVSQTKEFVTSSRFYLEALQAINSEIKLLGIQHSTLTPDAFKILFQLCKNAIKTRNLKSSIKLQEFGVLAKFIDQTPDLNEPHKFIYQIFDDNFIIRDNASHDLESIRTKIVAFKKTIYLTFKKELESIRIKGLLAEGEESVRNGRYVLRVPAEHKRKIRGLIVDESESGKTLFIEPQVCLELNNNFIELELKEKREIAKILFELTNKIRKHSSTFVLSYNILIELDIILAKANFALKIPALKPNISKDKKIQINKAFHPLLFLKLNLSDKVPVPLSLTLNPDNHLLLISGPNAGGKTIVLKTFGLLQLMLQKGLLIPVDKSSVFALFKNIWVDIGDWQSLDEGLSTYSARLSLMKTIVEFVNENSLVLLDELGSGTEPIIGGAIAESILSEFVKLKVSGIITTHYVNLKSFAHRTKGIINGAMVYDESKMEPLYKLQIGKPGSSYALDIANKLNFPKHLIHYAKQKSGKNVVDLESLISKLESEKANLELKNLEYLSKINTLNKLIKAYEDIQKQYELKRLKLKLESMEFELQKQNKVKQESNNLINEIKEKLDLVKAKQFQLENQNKIVDITTKLDEVTDQYYELLHKDKIRKDIKKGDKVHLIRHNTNGIVSDIGNKMAKVITEFVTFNVKIAEIILIEEDLVKSHKNKIQYNLVNSSIQFSTSLDLRGQSLQVALQSLEDYLDKALMANVKDVKIVHGKGSGVLRDHIHKSLKKHKFIEHFSHPENDKGGSGSTIIVFK